MATVGVVLASGVTLASVVKNTSQWSWSLVPAVQSKVTDDDVTAVI